MLTIPSLRCLVSLYQILANFRQQRYTYQLLHYSPTGLSPIAAHAMLVSRLGGCGAYRPVPTPIPGLRPPEQFSGRIPKSGNDYDMILGVLY